MLLRFGRPIGAIVSRVVAAELAADRAAVPARDARDLCVATTLLPKHCEGIPLRGGDLLITH